MKRNELVNKSFFVIICAGWSNTAGTLKCHGLVIRFWEMIITRISYSRPLQCVWRYSSSLYVSGYCLLNRKFFAEFSKKETRWSLSCKWICMVAVSFYRSHSGSHTERCSTQHGAFSITNITSSQSQLELCVAYFLKSLPKLSCFLETFWFSSSSGTLKQEKYLTKKSCLLKALLVSYFKKKIGNTYEGCSYPLVKSVLINKII